jgi:hypothetical protein
MNKKFINKYRSKITVNPNMKDYSRDPLILRKVSEAEAVLNKYGHPGQLPKTAGAKETREINNGATKSA